MNPDNQDIANAFYIVYAGIMYLMAGSGSGGSNSLQYALVGMVLVMGTWVIINTITGTLP